MPCSDDAGPAARAAILTYHRIVADGGRTRFHDLELAAFTAHVRRLREGTLDAGGGHHIVSGRGPVYVTFDDGTEDHRRAADILAAQGFSGVFFIIADKIGASGFLAADEIRAMAAQGHRIASHGLTHRHMTALDAAAVAAELGTSRARLEAITGGAVDWFAPPGGLYSREVVAAALGAGYAVFRTMDWGYAAWPLCGRVPSLPVLPRCDLAAFDRLLDGRAPLWMHTVKGALKRTLGARAYVALRDRAAGLAGK
jgi:peptidoglycan/xylan/chitin deacetylase (PgdA/CDA1 family)